MATRRAGPFEFDHGAQYFTARSGEFRHFLSTHFDATGLQDWQPGTLTLSEREKPYRRPWFEPHWIGVPAMNSFAGALPVREAVEFQAQVTALTDTESGWRLQLHDGRQRGPFDWVVVTALAAQTSHLLPAELAMQESLHRVRMSGCFSLMLGFQEPPAMPFNAAVVKDSPLAWLAVNSSKPGRTGPCSLLAQSRNDWADANLEQPRDRVTAQLLSALGRLLPELPEPDHLDLHRWRYAATTEPLGLDYLLESDRRLAACGDWCLGGRVEAAFTSANRLADALLALL